MQVKLKKKKAQYSWNTAKVGIKHQSINQTIKKGYAVAFEKLPNP